MEIEKGVVGLKAVALQVGSSLRLTDSMANLHEGCIVPGQVSGDRIPILFDCPAKAIWVCATQTSPMKEMVSAACGVNWYISGRCPTCMLEFAPDLMLLEEAFTPVMRARSGLGQRTSGGKALPSSHRS